MARMARWSHTSVTHAATCLVRRRRRGAPRRQPGRRVIPLVSLVGLVLVAGCTEEPGGGGIDKAGGTVAPSPVNLRLANTRGLEADPFLEHVKQQSGGALTLTADLKLGRPTLTNEPEALRAAQADQVDIAIVPTRSFDAVGVTAFDALMDPMLVDSLTLQDTVLADPVATDMLHSLKSSGLVGLALLSGPIQLPNGITRPMLGPGSYAGARIALNPSPISERALGTLSALPTGPRSKRPIWPASTRSSSRPPALPATSTTAPCAG